MAESSLIRGSTRQNRRRRLSSSRRVKPKHHRFADNLNSRSQRRRHSSLRAGSSSESLSLSPPQPPYQALLPVSGTLMHRGHSDVPFVHSTHEYGHYGHAGTDVSSVRGLFVPSLPDEAGRGPFAVLTNAFKDNAEDRIPYLNHVVPRLPGMAKVTGYIRFQVPLRKSLQANRNTDDYRFNQNGLGHPALRENRQWPSRVVSRQASSSQQLATGPFSSHPALALNIPIQTPLQDWFWETNLCPDERKLFLFYRKAWCPGRSILGRTNSWLMDVTQMAAESTCVRYAAISLAANYVLDYVPHEGLRQLANLYYRRAVECLDLLLEDPEEQGPGRGDCAVAAIALLNMLDVVSPEYRRPKDREPRWLEGARSGAQILYKSDQGPFYNDPNNVQHTDARLGNMIAIARATIIALPMTPLDPKNTENQKLKWLRYGTEKENLQIHGGCGFSPILFHIFFRITYLSTIMQQHPESAMAPAGAGKCMDSLRTLRQWSELNEEGYASTLEVLNSCEPSEAGIVESKKNMTDLTAEAWRLAAIIYLQCRLYRLPRDHPEVVSKMDDLDQCIGRMPTFGEVFTSQAPFFPSFLLGLVSVVPKHTQTAKRWFESVIANNQCRSSVPPAWEALKRTRVWMDEHNIGSNLNIGDKIDERVPWWETLVAQVMHVEGTLCLI